METKPHICAHYLNYWGESLEESAVHEDRPIISPPLVGVNIDDSVQHGDEQVWGKEYPWWWTKH